MLYNNIIGFFIFKNYSLAVIEKKIIIVDDENEILDLMQEAFIEAGYNTITTSNPHNVENKVLEFKPDVMVLDIWLGDSNIDGLDLLQSCLKINPSLQVLMMSGHGNIATAVKAMKLGAFSFVEKPFKMGYILIELEKIFQHVSLLKQVTTITAYGDVYGKAPGTDTLDKTAQIAEDKLNISKTSTRLTNHNQCSANDDNGPLLEVNYQCQMSKTLFSNSQLEFFTRLNILKNIFNKHYSETTAKLSKLEKYIMVSYKKGFPIKEFLLHALSENFIYETIQPGNKAALVGNNFTIFDCAYINYDQIIKILTKVCCAKTDLKSFFALFINWSDNVVPPEHKLEFQKLQNSLQKCNFIFAQPLQNTTNTLKSRTEQLIKKISIPGIFAINNAAENAFKDFLYHICNVLNYKPITLANDLYWNDLWSNEQIFDIQYLEALATFIANIYGNSQRSVTLNYNMILPLVQNTKNINNIISVENNTSHSFLDLPFKEAKLSFEKLYLDQQIQRFDGNIKKAADVMKMDRTALYRKIKDII